MKASSLIRLLQREVDKGNDLEVVAPLSPAYISSYWEPLNVVRVEEGNLVLESTLEELVACTHPDHVDGTSCEDRAVGCSPHCKCCMGELAKEAK